AARGQYVFVFVNSRTSAMPQTLLPILSVSPTRALVDEKMEVVVENLPPGFPVTLHSFHHSEDKDHWEAYGHYITDHRGMVSVAEDFSFGGTYKGKAAMGLLWSMRPVPGSRKGLRLRKMNVRTPLLVNISVYSGHSAEGFRERTPLASTLIERWYIAPGVQRIKLREKGLRGTLFIPSGPGPFPGLLEMWGGGGGLVEYRASLLASNGYACFALEYLVPDEVDTRHNVPMNYFERAFNILKEHPQVIPDKIGLFGLSLGSILAINLATESPIVKPACCVCISGGHLHLDGPNLNENNDMIRLDENNHQIWREMGLATFNTSKLVEVGKINCPLLLVNGDDDQNCIRTMYHTIIMPCITQKMKAAGKEHLLTCVLYPDAGHLIEPPFSPHFRATRFHKNVIVVWGGTTEPHSEAQEDSWRKILAFLQHHLYSSPILQAKM
uniref:Uncharacterized protein n=1 Tax=Mola mola TaxID=94237 RepID=A0A3Q3WA89_MOLML